MSGTETRYPLYTGGITKVTHDDSLIGDGTFKSPLSVAGSPSGGISLPNGEPFSMRPGQAITSSADMARLAYASSQGRATVLGFAALAADPTLPVMITPDGVLALTTAQWDANTGALGGLTRDATYYLSSVPGRITTTIPTSGFLVAVGRALTPQILQINPRPPILL